MEDAVFQRVKEIIRITNTPLRRISDSYGIKQNTFSQQISGRSAMSAIVLVSILRYFDGISAEWLIRGEGEMERKSAITPEIRFSSDVLKDIMNNEHLSEEQLADKIGMNIADVKEILCSHRLLNEAEFVLVAEAFPNYDTAWIRTHTGSMIYSPVSGNNNSIVQNMTGNGVQTANNANSELVTEVAVLKAQLIEKEKQIDMLKELLMNK